MMRETKDTDLFLRYELADTPDAERALRDRADTGWQSAACHDIGEVDRLAREDLTVALAEIDWLRVDRVAIVARYWCAVAYSERCPECGAVRVSGATWQREPHRGDCLFVQFGLVELVDGSDDA